MAKISVDDTYNGKTILTNPQVNHLWETASEVRDRLGPAFDLLEVLVIKPYNDFSPNLQIQIKIVIGSPERKELTISTRCDETVEFIQQYIVNSFRSALSEVRDELKLKDQLIADTLVQLRVREEKSGNDKRCDACGEIRKTLESSRGRYLVCERCNPKCPDCGHITAKSGFIFQCHNCGAEVGTH